MTKPTSPLTHPGQEACLFLLECVKAHHLDNDTMKFDALNMKHFEVYELHDFHSSKNYPIKGYDVDWLPYISKIP